MKYAGWRWREAAGAVLALALLGSFGCSEDEDSGPPTEEVTPGWSQLFAGQASDPDYGAPGSAADGLLAFASFRSSTRADSLGEHEHIWVLDLSDSTFYQITTGNDDDYDPAWSPSGARLVFTRDDGSRRDIYWVSVADPAAPGAPIRVTDRPVAFTGATDGQWVIEDGEEQIAFSDGKDVWRISRSGGSPIKLVPDPADIRPSDCGGLSFDDLRAVPSPADPRLAVVSRGRVPVGAIHVEARDAGGAPVAASLWLNPCDTLAVVGTEATFTDLPLGEYRVRGFLDGTGLCDTLDVPAIVSQTGGVSDTAHVTLSFAPTAGTLMLRSISTDASDFFYYLDCLPTRALANPVDPETPLDSLIFTPLTCVPAGVHIVGGTHGERVDTTWVNVPPGETTRVTLQFMDSTYVDSALTGTSLYVLPRGGEGSFFTRVCQGESIFVGVDPKGDSLWDCDIPWTERWVVQDTLCTGSGGGAPFDLAGRFPVLGAPQQGDEELWTFDPDANTFQLQAGGAQAQKPVWDPTGLNRLAYITRSGDNWGISILNLDNGLSTAVALPGRTGPFVCLRDAISLSWSPDGRYLAVGLSPCAGGSYPRDLAIWIADLSALDIL